ncbi:MAG TPA: class I SAM-dependent methyltransferase [Polyangiaceae bacterium]
MNKSIKSPRNDRVVVGAAAQAAVLERLKRRTQGGGKLAGACIPALAEHYINKGIKLFEVLDRPLRGAELSTFRDMMRAKLQEGFEASPHARFILAYHPSDADPMSLSCTLQVLVPSLEEQITEWMQSTGATQPFGKYPDAKVVEIARALHERGSSRVLDVGAGTGRNSLALARVGLSVTAVEPHARFAEHLRAVAVEEELSLAVLEADVLEETTTFPGDAFDLQILSEVVTHFTVSEVQKLLPRLVSALSAGGTLLFNAFVAKGGYQPDALARQASASVWSTFLTRQELEAATRSAGLEIVADEPALEYEKTHLPRDAWPKTPWYESWAQGNNLFATTAGIAPIELCWLTCRKRPESPHGYTATQLR